MACHKPWCEAKADKQLANTPALDCSYPGPSLQAALAEQSRRPWLPPDRLALSTAVRSLQACIAAGAAARGEDR